LAAIEKLNYLFLTSFDGGRDIQKCHFVSGNSLTQLHQIKRGSKMDLLIGKGNVSFVPDNCSTER